MAEKTTSATYRISDENKATIARIMASEKVSAEALFTEFVAAYEKDRFGNTAYGIAMQNDLESWTLHFAALQQLYENAVRMGIDAKTIATKELSGRITSAETALASLREKNEKAEADKKDLAEQLQATKRSLDTTLRELEKKEKESEDALKNAESWQNSIQVLTKQLENYQDKVKQFDEISAKLAQTNAQLLGLQAQNEALRDVIDNYMKSK